MIAYCGPHHTPPHEYPQSCRLQDEENARWIAAAPARIAALEELLREALSTIDGEMADAWRTGLKQRIESALANADIRQAGPDASK